MKTTSTIALPEGIKDLFSENLRLTFGFTLIGKDKKDRDVRVQLNLIEGKRTVSTVTFEMLIPQSLWNRQMLDNVGHEYVKETLPKDLTLKTNFTPDGTGLQFELRLFDRFLLGTETMPTGRLSLKAA
ncbi:MAG: hypothetical protein WC763_04435 [Candidatus Paceibacterota bacterium]|jgi:hypothetical protein